MAADPKVEHLKFVQAVIARMATNSFLLKGWTVTLVSALFAFGAKEADRTFVLIAWIPVFVFAGLDAYYLWHERMYRRLHAKVAGVAETAIDYSMDISEYRTTDTWPGALRSKTVMGFYAPVAILLGVLTLYVLCSAKTPPTPVQGPKTITISIQ